MTTVLSRDYNTSSMFHCRARIELTDPPADRIGIMSTNYDRNESYY
jgi:hypothetical protein